MPFLLLVVYVDERNQQRKKKGTRRDVGRGDQPTAQGENEGSAPVCGAGPPHLAEGQQVELLVPLGGDAPEEERLPRVELHNADALQQLPAIPSPEATPPPSKTR